jgi:hypothetical protein
MHSIGRARHNFSLWAYVIMPNHVHLLLMPRAAEYRISVILKAIKQPVAFRALECCRARKLEAATSGPRARQGWQGQPEAALGRQGSNVPRGTLEGLFELDEVAALGAWEQGFRFPKERTA